MIRRLVTAGATAALAAGLCVVPTTTAQAAVPKGWDCSASQFGYSGNGTRQFWSYDGGRTSSETFGPGRLGYLPRDTAQVHRNGRGSMPKVLTIQSFTLDGPRLREVTERVVLGDRSRESTTFRTRVMHKRWGGIRQISVGEGNSYLYGLTKSGIRRYKLSGTPGSTRVSLDQTIAASGWSRVRSLSYVGSWGIGGVKHDVFIALRANQLVMYGFPQNNPRKWTGRTLKFSGYSTFETVNAHTYCSNSNGTEFGGYVLSQADGDIYLEWDRNKRDFSGSDMGRIGRVQTAWRGQAYND